MRGLKENDVVYIGCRLNKTAFFDCNISYMHERMMEYENCTEQTAVFWSNGAKWKDTCVCRFVFLSDFQLLKKIDRLREIHTTYVRCADCGALCGN